MPRRFSGARCRQKRHDAGLRAETVAVAIDRSYHSVCEYEYGRVIPSLTTAIALADFFGCPLDDLLEEVTDAA